MPPSRSFVVEFALKVFLPSLASAAVVALLFVQVFGSVFGEVNRVQKSHELRQAAAARDSLEQALSAGGQPDAVFLVAADGSTISATLGGQAAGIGAGDYFGPAFDGIRKASEPSFVMIGGHLTLAAASRREIETLITARQIGPADLAEIGRRQLLDDLRLAPPGQGGFDIVGAGGEAVASLAWRERKPGDLVKTKFRDVITAALTTFMFVVGLLIYMSWRGFKEAHESKARAIAASLQDELTGLANRRSMLAALTEPSSPGGGLSVVYADLDGFKEVNDAYGHEVGDQLLRAVAAGFSFCANEERLVARFGGDEFAVIVEGGDHAARARRLAGNMIALFAEPMVFNGRIAAVAASIGIVDAAGNTVGPEEMLRRADVAMYAAKANGRNGVHIYETSLDFKRDLNRGIAAELRDAIDRRSLGVVYQPIVDARSRRMTGVEALVRWPRESSRKLTPDIFVPVAEEYGLIEDMGFLVLSEACREAAHWPGITVAVNVSPVQFMNPTFADEVARTLQASGLGPGRLEIEVTEGFVIDNAELATSAIDRLHEMRVSVALDDFGTGYSSIGHLRRFKFDKLKLDRSMVEDILHQPAALRLVQGTIAMADSLGLRVTAEGIEDENQVSVLRLAGCSQFQGFLFSKPVEAAEIGALLNGFAIARSL